MWSGHWGHITAVSPQPAHPLGTVQNDVAIDTCKSSMLVPLASITPEFEPISGRQRTETRSNNQLLRPTDVPTYCLALASA